MAAYAGLAELGTSIFQGLTDNRELLRKRVIEAAKLHEEKRRYDQETAENTRRWDIGRAIEMFGYNKLKAQQETDPVFQAKQQADEASLKQWYSMTPASQSEAINKYGVKPPGDPDFGRTLALALVDQPALTHMGVSIPDMSPQENPSIIPNTGWLTGGNNNTSPGTFPSFGTPPQPNTATPFALSNPPARPDMAPVKITDREARPGFVPELFSQYKIDMAEQAKRRAADFDAVYNGKIDPSNLGQYGVSIEQQQAIRDSIVYKTGQAKLLGIGASTKLTEARTADIPKQIEYKYAQLKQNKDQFGAKLRQDDAYFNRAQTGLNTRFQQSQARLSAEDKNKNLTVTQFNNMPLDDQGNSITTLKMAYEKAVLDQKYTKAGTDEAKKTDEAVKVAYANREQGYKTASARLGTLTPAPAPSGGGVRLSNLDPTMESAIIKDYAIQKSRGIRRNEYVSKTAKKNGISAAQVGKIVNGQ